MLGPLKHLAMILLGEVRRQMMDRRKVQLPPRNHLQNTGKTTGRATCSNAPARNRLRHSKPLRAKREHRRASVFEIELSSIDLGDVRDQSRRVLSIFVDEAREVLQQPSFVETTECIAVVHELDANTGV